MAKKSKSRGASTSTGEDKAPVQPERSTEAPKSGCCGGGSSASNVAPSPERSQQSEGWQPAEQSAEELSPVATTAPTGDEAESGAAKDEVSTADALPTDAPENNSSGAAASGSSNPPGAEPEAQKPKAAPTKKETFGTFVDSFAPSMSLGNATGSSAALPRADSQDELAALVEVSMDQAEQDQAKARSKRTSASNKRAAPVGDAEAALAAAEGDEKVSRALEKVGVQPMGRQRRDSATIAHDSPTLANTPLGRRLQAQAEEKARRESQAGLAE